MEKKQLNLFPMLIIVFIVECILLMLPSGAQQLKKITVSEVVAVDGGRAALACDVKHPPDDAVFLLLFFNDNLTTPIYSYDLRPGLRDSVTHWMDTTVLGGRANLVMKDRVAELQISSVKEKDEGFYKCRVDFMKHPTRTTRISLKVIVPPKSLKIHQEGREVKSVIGPFQEGESTTLQCIAYGGRPLPRIYWFYGDHIIDKEMDVPEEKGITQEAGHKIRNLPSWKRRKNKRVSNTVSLGPFTRNDMMKSVTCEASNTKNQTSPMAERVRIDMNLPPLLLNMVGPEDPLSAGRNYTFICEVVGSRPPPSITWLKGTMRIDGTTEETTADGNVTKSSLTLIPTPPDDGTKITCRGQNSETETSLERSLALSVHYIPEAFVNLASFLNPNNIKEGDDVYFECSITANPNVYKISWHHNGRLLEANKTAGVIISNHSLVLQKVQRRHGGQYFCTASNIEGDGSSASVNLDVKYAPVCAPDQVTTYGIAKKEDAEVTCQVNANPKAKSFKWTFNNTADTIDVPPGKYTTMPESSIITYTPVNELDFGTLLCWAENTIGAQTIPCVFHIVPAGRPDPPTSCNIVNKTSISFGVWCQPGFDGGLQQVFLIRINKEGGKAINITNGEPYFKIQNLVPGTSYKLQVSSANDKGSSGYVNLNAFTLNAPHGPSELEVRKNEEQKPGVIEPSSPSNEDNLDGVSTKRMQQAGGIWKWNMAGIIPLIAGIGVGVPFITAISVLLIRYKMRTSRAADAAETPDNEDNSHTHFQTSSGSMLFHARHSDVTLACDKRQHQLGPEEVLDRGDQMSSVDVDVTGPLIQPPTCYAGKSSATPKGCYRHLPRNEGAESPPHKLISHFQEKGGIVTYHASTAGLVPPHHYSPHHAPPLNKVNNPPLQHILQRQTVKPQPQEFGSIGSPRQTITPSLVQAQIHTDVPTVYATLGSRGSRGQQVISLRNAHSQASLDLPYDPRDARGEMAHARGFSPTCSHLLQEPQLDSSLPSMPGRSGGSNSHKESVGRSLLRAPCDHQREDGDVENKRESSV